MMLGECRPLIGDDGPERERFDELRHKGMD